MPLAAERRAVPLAAAMLFCVATMAVSAPADRWTSLLERLEQETEISPAQESRLRSLQEELVERWDVEVAGQLFTIGIGPLQSALSDWTASPGDAAARERVKRMAGALLEHARRAVDAAPGADPAAARSALETILHRREFAGARPPGWLDRFRSSISRWLIGLLEKLFGAVYSGAGLMELLVWATVGLFFVAVIWWIVRASRSASARLLTFERVPVRQPGPAGWTGMCRAAATAGDWREAMRCGYWAAVARLAEGGVWSLDMARTHREYLRLLPRSHASRGDMEEVTHCYEQIWYGHSVTPERITRAFAHLERLGCTLDSTPAIEES